MTHQATRRAVVAGAMAASALAPQAFAAAGEEDWRAGPVKHLLPAASHDHIRIKVSTEPLKTPPVLSIGSRKVRGRATGPGGRHWAFDVPGLKPAQRYILQISSEAGSTDPWPLKTLPSPGADPTHLRILAYTCAGGQEYSNGAKGSTGTLPIAMRRALLAKGLSFDPDVVVANGDHIYWDQEVAFRRPTGASTREYYRTSVGLLDPTLTATAPGNLAVLAEVGRRQVGDLYGTLLRSTPSWFIRDDHDYFENDEANDGRTTFPPSLFRRGLTDAVQAMYWPEFLPSPGLPADIPGGDTSFGALRWGRLAELLMYDCRLFVDLGLGGGFIPAQTEQWIAARTADASIGHVMQVPSTPFGWTAGKWGEWYPDVLGPDGKLTTKLVKTGWNPSWFAQQKRLLKIAGSRGKPSLALSGDLHAVGMGEMTRTGDVALGHPVHMVLTGPVGTGDAGYPSTFRGTPPQIAHDIQMNTALAPLEKNGFTILDVTPDAVRVRIFAWRPPQAVSEIGSLEPVLDTTVRTG